MFHRAERVRGRDRMGGSNQSIALEPTGSQQMYQEAGWGNESVCAVFVASEQRKSGSAARHCAPWTSARHMPALPPSLSLHSL